MNRKYSGVVSVLVIVVLTACAKDCPVCEKTTDDDPVAPAYLSSAYFTTGFDSLDQPVENLDTVAIDSVAGDTLYLYVKWFDFEAGTVTYRTEWYDGGGSILNVFENPLTLPAGNWSIKTWQVVRSIDRTGTWNVKTLIDGVVALEKTIVVE